MWTRSRAAARHAAREEALFAAHVEQALQIVSQPVRSTVQSVQSVRPRALVRH
jgi:hypothetical protein